MGAQRPLILVAAGLVLGSALGMAAEPVKRGIALVNKLAPISDPLWIPDSKAGFSVAADGDTVAVGAPTMVFLGGGHPKYPGGVVVYTRTGDSWSTQDIISPIIPGDPPARVGHAVGLEGDKLVVGEPGNPDTGSVFAYRRVGTSWDVSHQNLVAPGLTVNAGYGTAVAISGDTIVAGAPAQERSGLGQTGAAYVFVWDGNTWVFQDRLVASDGAAGDRFGAAVDIEGDTVMVGAPDEDHGVLGVDVGKVYTFGRSASTWSQDAILIPSDGLSYDHFGAALALDDGTLHVGSPDDDHGGLVDAGSVYYFSGSGSSWQEISKLTASDAASSDRFGSATSLDGDRCVVGAAGDDDVGRDAGAAYVFGRYFAIWTQRQKLLPGPGSAYDEFGASVSLSGLTAIVGAPLDDNDNGDDAGSAAVFVEAGSSWELQSILLPPSDDVGSQGFGWSLAASGDTAVAGAPSDDHSGLFSNPGSVYVWNHDGGGWGLEQKLYAPSPTDMAKFGDAVDVDGDTLVVGEPGLPPAGTAHVYVRSVDGWSRQQSLLPSDYPAPGYFGLSVALSGDTLVIGAPYASEAGLEDAGAVYVFQRVGSVWTEEQRLVAGIPSEEAAFGRDVDVQGDTVVVGAPRQDVLFFTDAGRVYVFNRSGEVWAQHQVLTAASPIDYQGFGTALALSGVDMLVGAPYDDPVGLSLAGSVSAFSLVAGTWGSQQVLTASDLDETQQFGQSVAMQGRRAVIGAPLDDEHSIPGVGSVYVFTRPTALWGEAEHLRSNSPHASDHFGYQVAMAGPWVFVAPETEDFVGEDSGAVYVFLDDSYIFADGFESGDTSAWSIPAAAAKSLQSRPPLDRWRHQCRFHPGRLQHLGPAPTMLAVGMGDDGQDIFALDVRRVNDQIRVRLRVREASGGWVTSTWSAVADLNGRVELEWSPSERDAANGELWLTVAGGPVAWLTDLDQTAALHNVAAIGSR